MILAIDLGSTTFKAAVYDQRLRQVWARNVPVQYRYGRVGHVELVNVDDTMQRLLPRRRRITSIAITSQAQTFTVVDRAGRARRPFISWQDQRANIACAVLKRRLPDFATHASFGELLPALQICQIHHQPLAPGETALLLPSYFIRQWTGENVTDDNIAAMSGLYSMERRTWWTDVARPEQLPRVVPVGAIGGVTRPNRFGLPPGIPVVLAGNDQTAGAFGARLEENGATLVTLGTAQVAYRVTRCRPSPQMIRGPYPGGKTYAMVADEFGGNLVNWATRLLRGCATPEQFFAAAGRAPVGCHGLRFDADTGTWEGLGLHHTPYDLARSILECLSRRLAALSRRLMGGRGTRVLVSGGGAQDSIWRQILARELRRHVRPCTASPLLGAARMACHPCSGESRG